MKSYIQELKDVINSIQEEAEEAKNFQDEMNEVIREVIDAFWGESLESKQEEGADSSFCDLIDAYWKKLEKEHKETEETACKENYIKNCSEKWQNDGTKGSEEQKGYVKKDYIDIGIGVRDYGDVITVEAPGYDKSENMSITIDRELLTVSGKCIYTGNIRESKIFVSIDILKNREVSEIDIEYSSGVIIAKLVQKTQKRVFKF
jgi:hypothetical protein